MFRRYHPSGFESQSWWPREHPGYLASCRHHLPQRPEKNTHHLSGRRDITVSRGDNVKVYLPPSVTCPTPQTPFLHLFTYKMHSCNHLFILHLLCIVPPSIHLPTNQSTIYPFIYLSFIPHLYARLPTHPSKPVVLNLWVMTPLANLYLQKEFTSRFIAMATLQL